ncbi:spore coat protein U domain-containing protein [Hyphomicrobium sp. CS1GBMeth3]|uniref:Csu type fimbrial protein n=1 Tax=Hyphomicrobium sp. CS1GBMeth3 TaxID=1892845 RepID=UPI00092FDECC|nr:spore coat protein U domain-containing protein [Hyphomicrobium sp. CS1GBMeth3]
MSRRGLRTLPAVTIAFLALTSGGAWAQTCNGGITNIDFGNIDVTANTSFPATGTYSITCTAIASAVRTCPNINAGTGGGSATGDPRYMTNGANQLQYNLFTDPSHTTVWGSRLWALTAPATDITLVILGQGSASRTIYAQIPAGQQTLPPGTYTSSFAGSETAITYAGYLLSLPLLAPSCATLASPSLTMPFTVSVTIDPHCGVTATMLDFGATGVLQTAVDATNTLFVTCSATTPYSISLNGGLTGAVDPTQRKMSKGGETVTYGLYRNTVRTLPWGETIGSNTAAGVGTGLAQSFTVYGRVPAQQTPSPGTYTDTVVVTVTY